jgi:predicted MPP superfamily phosphohydrolase
MRTRFYLLIAIAAFLTYAGLVEPYWIAETTHEVSIRGLGPVPLTIVHLADIHTIRLGLRERRIIERVNRIDPDYVFISGDLIKNRRDISAGLAFLAELRARYGVYFVPGNADDRFTEVVGKDPNLNGSSSWRMLVNEHIDCGTFTLVGLGDPVTHNENIDRAFHRVPDYKPVFVMTHFHPDSLLQRLKDRGVDLVCSGHTHGGQVGLAPIVGIVPYASRSRYLWGLYELDGLHLSVTRGIGTNILPLRFLCRPEIVVLRLTGH